MFIAEKQGKEQVQSSVQLYNEILYKNENVRSTALSMDSKKVEQVAKRYML